MPSGHKGRRGYRRRAARFLAASPRRMATWTPGPTLHDVSPAVCDKRAQYVGILRPSCKEGKKKGAKVPPSC